MPRQQATSGLTAKVGGAVQAHAGDTVDYGNASDLPSGIVGVAQLTQCYFGQYEKGDNKGEYFFRAAGTIVKPEFFESNGAKIKVQGRTTSIGPIPVCDTVTKAGKTTTMQEYVAEILNEMRKLGYDTSGMTAEDLEAAASALEKAAPHFKFRTWGGGKWTGADGKERDGRVNHDWQGVVEYTEGGGASDSNDGVVEKTQPNVDKPKSQDKPKPKAQAESAPDVPNTAALTKLGKDADKDNEPAQDKLTELALTHGVMTQDEITNAESWSAVATAINDKLHSSAPDADDTPDESAGGVLNKGDIVNYTLPDGKTVECEVTAVFPGKKTANLKNVTTDAMYKSVEWSQLEY